MSRLEALSGVSKKRRRLKNVSNFAENAANNASFLVKMDAKKLVAGRG
jgi:hypothetical protein